MGAGDSITGSGNSDEPLALDSVYLIDDSGLLTSEDTDKLTSAGVKLTSTDKTASELIDQLTDADAGKVLVTISADESGSEVLGYTVKT